MCHNNLVMIDNDAKYKALDNTAKRKKKETLQTSQQLSSTLSRFMSHWKSHMRNMCRIAKH